jgi:FkbM family methyltransferase
MNKILKKIKNKISSKPESYSQTGEDLIIETMNNKEHGFYVDIGANHPKKINNTYLFYKKGWTGINIEPNPSRIWRFKLWRKRDINLNIGIGPNKSEMDFYSFKESTLSTFDKSSSESYEKMGHKIKNVIKIPVSPLKEILNQYASNKEIDILSVDTEGFDMEVLESNDWNKFKPNFIILETIEYERNGGGKKLNHIFDPYLKEKGYEKIAETYINSIYAKKKNANN